MRITVLEVILKWFLCSYIYLKLNCDMPCKIYDVIYNYIYIYTIYITFYKAWNISFVYYKGMWNFNKSLKIYRIRNHITFQRQWSSSAVMMYTKRQCLNVIVKAVNLSCLCINMLANMKIFTCNFIASKKLIFLVKKSN